MGSNGTGKITQPNCQRTENNEKQRLNSSSFSLLQIHPFKSDLLHVADGQTAKFLTASPPRAGASAIPSSAHSITQLKGHAKEF